jgi:CheY-like chemotaxis protein
VVGEHILRKHGFEVVTAADGLQALQLFRMRPNGFSLALVDQMMPRMGGTALIRELRALSPGLRVISSTGLSAEQGAEQSDAEDLIRLGVRTRLPKPYTSDELLAALRRELDAN